MKFKSGSCQKPSVAAGAARSLVWAAVVQPLVSLEVAVVEVVGAALLQQWAQVPGSWVVLGALPPCS